MAHRLDITYNREAGSLELSGSWRIGQIESLITQLDSIALSAETSSGLIVDGAQLLALDTACAMELLDGLERKTENLGPLSFINFSEKNAEILELVQAKKNTWSSIVLPERLNLIQRIGRSSVQIYEQVVSLIRFILSSVGEFTDIFFKPSGFRPKETTVQIEQTFVDAIPVVALVNFLVGIVLAYLFAIHAEQYGANIFVVDSVAFAMCREFSPLIVAVIVAGRSGSAFAAQLGAMKLNEEISALQTLGLSPLKILVFPRVIGMVIAVPLLVFIGDVVGILGGMLVADMRLGITEATFVERLRIVLTTGSFFAGLIKAPFFAAFIAIIACRLGLEAENDARSVGKNTTAAVVQGIVSVILLNACFAILFAEVGL